MGESSGNSAPLEYPEKLAASFYKETNNCNDMTKEQFFRVTGCHGNDFGNKLFDTLDGRKIGKINFGDMMNGFAQLRADNADDRIRFVFGIYDLDGDGVITRQDLKRAITASVEESNCEMTEEEMGNLINALLQLFDADKKDDIRIEDFARVLKNYPDLLQEMSFGSFGETASSAHSEKKRAKRAVWVEKMKSWVLDYPQILITYGIAILLFILAFLWMFLKFSGDCDDSNMELRDPLTGYTRQEIVELSQQYGRTITEDDQHYMVFSHQMSLLDSITCRDARKRRLMSWSLPIAKGVAQTMKVVFTLILLPVSRTLMTTLRETFLKQIFYFDGAIEFHKFLGRMGFYLAWLHTLCHVACIKNCRDPDRFRYWSWAYPDKRKPDTMDGIRRDQDANATLNNTRVMTNGDIENNFLLMTLNTKDQPTSADLVFSMVAITGIILIVVYTTAVLFAFDYPKKLNLFKPTKKDTSGRSSSFRKLILRIGRTLNNFNNFWYTHHLFSIFYVALLFHPLSSIPSNPHETGAKDTWIWVIVPLIVYVIERILRIKRSTSYTRVLAMDILPGDVIGLKVLRPTGFRYTPGQYVFIRCPHISTFEWHPFTLTSCPGDSYLSVHIRKVGDWTGALYEVGDSYKMTKATSMHTEENPVASTSADVSKYLVKPVVGQEMEVAERFPITISVDGPFGAPAQDYSDYKVIMLIGAGIGVTPFASVLTDLIDALKKCACIYCGRTNTQHMRTPLQKVYFYWTVKSRSEASWFKHLLEAIALQDTDGLLEINIHITGIKGAKDLRTMMLSLAQYESNMESASDPHSRAVTRFGRINWISAFDKVKSEFPNVSNVGVFYCGPNRLAKYLEELCRDLSRGPTTFSFMKECFG